MTTHSYIRKFERLIWSFPWNCDYDRTLEAEWRGQADLQQKSKIQDNTSDEIELVFIWTVTRYLDKGETVVEMNKDLNCIS